MTEKSDLYRLATRRRLPSLPGNVSSRNLTTCARHDSLNSSLSLEKNSTEITPEILREIVVANPDILDEIVMESVTSETIESWINIKRSQGQAMETEPAIEYGNRDIVEFQKGLMAKTVEKQTVKDLPDGFDLYCDISKILLKATKATGVTMYIMGKDNNMVNAWTNGNSLYPKGEVDMAIFTANRKTGQLLKDAKKSKYFKNAKFGNTVSLIAVPIVTPDESIVGVLVLTKEHVRSPFTEYDFQTVNFLVSWTCVGVYFGHRNIFLGEQKEMNDYLVAVVQKMFTDIDQFDTLLETIMTYTKNLVGADRCAIFMLDKETKELYADLFDEGKVDASGKPLYTKKSATIRFPLDKGIVGYCVTEGILANISDVTKDDRFYSGVDQVTAYHTKSVLCVPIASKGSVLGALETINKKNGPCFTESDEEVLTTFSVYFALAMKYSQIYTKMSRDMVQADIALDQIRYHTNYHSDEEKAKIMKEPTPAYIPDNFNSHNFYPKGYEEMLSQLFNYMIFQRIGENTFNLSCLSNFVLSVRKNYRDLPYHNWIHGFTVTHCMYWLLSFTKDVVFTELDTTVLLFAAICHDVDHRGYNNSFYLRTQQPLSMLYSTSVMEQHHFQTTMHILQCSKILNHLSEEQYKAMTKEIKKIILATDFTNMVANLKTICPLVDSGTFDMNNDVHREYFRGLLVMVCDLCVCIKDWPVQVEATINIYEEFFDQGDREKEYGLEPLPAMDRVFHDKVPESQLNFLQHQIKPAYECLYKIEPRSVELLHALNRNIDLWKRVAAGETVPPWREDALLNLCGSETYV